MRKLLAILSLCIMSTCSAPIPAQGYTEQDNPDGSRTIQIPAASVKVCKEQGDCYLVSKVWMMELVSSAMAEGKKLCGLRTEVR